MAKNKVILGHLSGSAVFLNPVCMIVTKMHFKEPDEGIIISKETIHTWEFVTDEAIKDAFAGKSDCALGASYQDKLTELDAEFREVVSHAKRRLIVFGDKFPLRYFFDEYGLEYRAAFSGCSTDTEPSAKTIAYLIDKVREEQIPAVYYLELSSPRVAEIIGEETGAEPLLFHSCHNVTRHQFDSGVTYLELMEQNVKNLKKGLS